MSDKTYVSWFDDLNSEDIFRVGGKNALLKSRQRKQRED
jgi:hypothetical protein